MVPRYLPEPFFSQPSYISSQADHEKNGHADRFSCFGSGTALTLRCSFKFTHHKQKSVMQINPLFFETPEVAAIGSEFGAEGELTVIRLLCAIGKDDYYMRWDHMHKMAFIGRSVATMTSDLLDRIVARMAEYGLIDAEMLESAGVITSAEIQRQYVRTMGRARCRRRAEWPYLLICLPTAASGGLCPGCRIRYAGKTRRVKCRVLDRAADRRISRRKRRTPTPVR